MFTIRVLAIFAVVFAAVMLAQPKPVVAQSTGVDQMMGVAPTSPGGGPIGQERMGIIIENKDASPGEANGEGTDTKPGINDETARMGIVIENKPGIGGDAAKKGIIIVDSKPGAGGAAVSKSMGAMSTSTSSIFSV